MEAKWKIGEHVHMGAFNVDLIGTAPEEGMYWWFEPSSDIHWPFPACGQGGAGAERGPFPTREAALEDAKAQGITWEG